MLDWFLKNKQSDKQTVEISSVEVSLKNLENNVVGDDFSNEWLENIKTQKFKDFETQLKRLEVIPDMTSSAKYRAAMATSEISIEEINENINTLRIEISRQRDTFIENLNLNSQAKQDEAQINIDAIVTRINNKREEIVALTTEIESFSQDIQTITQRIKDNDSENNLKLDKFQVNCNNILGQLNKFSQDLGNIERK